MPDCIPALLFSFLSKMKKNSIFAYQKIKKKNMKTTTELLQSEQIMQIFRKVAPLLNKTHFAQFEAELRKLVPTENSEVMIKAGYSLDKRSASIHVFINEVLPAEKVVDWHFEQIIPLWIERTDEKGRSLMLECLAAMDSCQGRRYEISGSLADFRTHLNEYYIHFMIKKK
jgi:hypothetical protein